jgi:hypothetical protein
MTSVVRWMTPTHREKGPADATLPRSSEARYPQGTGPLVFLLLFNPTPRRGCPGAAAQAQRLLFHNSHRVPADHIGTVLNTAGAEARASAALPHLGCAHAQAPAGPVCMCARAAACRVQRRNSGLRKPAASRVDTAEMDLCPVGLPVRSSALQAEEAGSLWTAKTGQDAACCGPQAWRIAPALPHGVPTHWSLAQLAAQRSPKPKVAGSSPAWPATSTEALRRAHASRGANRPQRLGGVGTRYRQPSHPGVPHEEEPHP